MLLTTYFTCKYYFFEISDKQLWLTKSIYTQYLNNFIFLMAEAKKNFFEEFL